ncbi:TPA: hypothetical protein I7114_22035 [Vibrio vulnificus]|nr:hypothetical protein [Vibrio vulnificus]ELS9099656.1 hypothetical protein [Vibrio vulnificus]HAS6069372.1 hypothetical protein [Vibrio vulnificus]HDY7924379.1 hypothetical protein [Vibrio vulnificus]HDY8053181.1 hypothetical protein [Vibrio vulnificus]
MENSEVLTHILQFLKPSSAILGLLAVLKFFHSVLDSGRVYKIKQLEFLNCCLKDPESGGKAYTIEKLIESSYKVHIPYEQTLVIMEHEKRQTLFALYKSSEKYLDFKERQFSLLPKFSSPKAIRYEKYRSKTIAALKYYLSALLGCFAAVIAYQKFFIPGLFDINVGTYNIVWFSALIFIALALFVYAFQSLVNESSIIQAQKFVKYFQLSKAPKRIVWAY